VNYHRWFWRMSKWARKPPSAKRVRFVLGIVAIGLCLLAWEHFIGAPDWMEIQRIRP